MSSSLPPPQVEYGADEISALVLDPGYSVTRAGFAGEDAPKSVIPSYYGRLPSQPQTLLFDDNAVYNPAPGLEIHNPMSEDGLVEDWDVAAKLWEYAITSRLTGKKQTSPLRNGLNDGTAEKQNGEDGDVAMEDAVDGLEKPMAESPLLVTEPGWNSDKNRKKTIEIAMEDWGVPAFWLGRSGVLAAFASGKPSGIVIDVGASNTSVTPVYDGLMLKKGMTHAPFGSNYISSQIRSLFATSTPVVPLTPHYLVAGKTQVNATEPAQASYRDFGANAPSQSFRVLQEERVLTEFKESCVRLWDPARNNGQPLANSHDFIRGLDQGTPFEMPDGYNNVFGVERYTVAEGLFDATASLPPPPDAPANTPVPTAQTTIPALVKRALAAVDTDIKPTLLNNVVLTGASTVIPGMAARIGTEVQAMFPSLKVRLQAPGNVVERRYAAWIGGSVLASLGTFHQMWVSKREYDEVGPSVVERRCK